MSLCDMHVAIARRSIATLVVTLVCGTGAAAAQELPAVSLDADAEATEFFTKGSEAFTAKKYDEAYEAFRQAWRLKKTYRTAANLAMSELKLGKTRDAAEHLQAAMKLVPAAESAESTEEKAKLIQKYLEEAKTYIGTLKLEIDVTGAQVYVDGSLAGTSPMDEVYLEPGRRVVEVSHPGYKTVQKILSVTAGDTQHERLSLEPIAAAPAKEAPSGRPASPQHSRQPPSRSKIPWDEIAIGAGGVTGVGLLLTGTAFTVWSDDTSEAADRVLGKLDKIGGASACSMPGQNAADCERLATLRTEQSRTANVALGTLLAGGTITAATVVYYAVIASKQRASSAPQVVPVAGAGHAAIVVRGQW